MNIIESTDDWSIGKIIKYILLPKPKGSPKAGKKEIALRLCFAAIFASFLAYRFWLSDIQIPECNQAEILSSIEKIINSQPITIAANIKFVTLKNITEQGYNENTELRACHATLITTAGEDRLQYSIRWQDKNAGIFHIDTQIIEYGDKE